MSQTERIKRHLLTHNSISPLEALRRFRVFRLAARVGELRSSGMAITTVMIRRGQKKYARYVMG